MNCGISGSDHWHSFAPQWDHGLKTSGPKGAQMIQSEQAKVGESDQRPISLDARLQELEANLIHWALSVSRGNKSRAARLLQIKRSTLGDRINRLERARQSGEEASTV